jgi:hypothetical protein
MMMKFGLIFRRRICTLFLNWRNIAITLIKGNGSKDFRKTRAAVR